MKRSRNIYGNRYSKVKGNVPQDGCEKSGKNIQKNGRGKSGKNTQEGRKEKNVRSTGRNGKAPNGKNTGAGRGRENISAVRASVSQNFITSQKLIHRIIRLSTIGKSDTVLEIGTGKGHLTQMLCKEAGQVYSVEIDHSLYKSAQERLSGCNNLRLIHGDFLQYKLPEKGDYSVFANIPFCITTQIMEKLTNAVNKPKDVWLVMEKGAAKRFLGMPNENVRSLRLKVYWNSEIRYYFQREDFHPMPSVDSVLVHFSLKEEPDLNREEYSAFCRFVDEAAKRGLCGKNGLLTNRQAAAALKRAGLPHAHEDGVTLYIQWLCLFQCWRKQRR